MVGLKSRKEEKPAFHLRRSWSWSKTQALGDELSEAVAGEVQRLMPILRDIWTVGTYRPK